MVANYDFQSLSPRDFEQLARQLLNKKLSTNFEIFKEGKDQGIDLLKRMKGNNEVIVQCKRYAPDAFNRLKSDIENKELKKVQKQSPKKYILFTSVKLSLANKEELLKILFPFCQDTFDIFSASDINGLLDDYPDIEEANFKLWLTSTPVLQKVLTANIANFSDHGIEFIRKHYAKFVFNSSVPKARKILKDNHYCIIAGKPGIGKTTLAHVLLSEFISDGYEMVSVSHDIEEAWTKHRHGKKQIFYYDDFLGQTNLQPKLEKNEDDRLLKFIDSIESTKESFFILTTREYILNQAALTYEKINRRAKGLEKCIIELEDYTKLNKAEILYNHIYFSSLDTLKKLELLNPSVYQTILNHKNYYPRLIEDITDRNFLKEVTNLNYSEAVLAYFDNPAAIWERAFRSLSYKAQVLLLVLTTFYEICYYPEVEDAFNATYKYLAKQKNWPEGLTDFVDALAELDGSPVKVTKVQLLTFSNTRSAPTEGFVIEFENPSIRDYLENYLLNNAQIVRDLFVSAKFFDQIVYLLNLKVGSERKDLLSFLRPITDSIWSILNSRLGSSAFRIKQLSWSQDSLAKYYVDWESCTAEKMATIISLLLENKFCNKKAAKEYASEFMERIENHHTDLNGLVKFGDLVKSLNKNNEGLISLENKSLRQKIVEKTDDLESFYTASDYIFDTESEEEHEELVDRIYDAACYAVEKAISDEETTQESLEELKDKVSHFSNWHGMDFSDLSSRLEDKITELYETEMHHDYEYQGNARHTPSTSKSGGIFSQRDEIQEMFEQLKSEIE